MLHRVIANQNFLVRLSLSLTCWAILSGDVLADQRCDLPPGFRLVKVAGDELATNVFCMISLADGSALVSGPGYIRKLIDDQDDGVFDRFELISEFPQSGAQGLSIDENDVLCVGDGAIWRLPNALKSNALKSNALISPDAAVEPIELFRVSTNGEHHAHAIRKGPDGWWYFIAGNETVLGSDESESVSGPVLDRRAGFLMRLSPDFSQREILAHGFRNAYDFDFNSLGQLFTYDSDGERDVSLPWYRPTRIFEIRPGDDAGWVTKSWKRPSSHFDMPSLVGSTGRGSPTGVCCYSGTQFPATYRDAIFAGDWTFGRVVVAKRDVESGRYAKPDDFLVAGESFGFPVTDLAIDRDGSLLISVGGRGTEGGVYRVVYAGVAGAEPAIDPEIGFVRKAIFSDRTRDTDNNAWAIAACQSADTDRQIDALAFLVSCGNEVGVAASIDSGDLFKTLAVAAESDDPAVWRNIYRLFSAMEKLPNRKIEIANLLSADAKKSSRLNRLFAVATANDAADRKLILSQLLAAMRLANEKEVFPVATMCRLAQLTLGGAGGVEGVFSGLVPKHRVEFSRAENDQYAECLSDRIVFEKGPSTRMELGRLAAMLGVASDELTQRFVSQIDVRSPVDNDVHWLGCLAVSRTTIDEKICKQVAAALKGLNHKAIRQKRNIDSRWQPMLTELATELFRSNVGIAQAVLATDFGTPDHAFMFGAFPEPFQTTRRVAVYNWCFEYPESVTEDHVRVLAEDPTGIYLQTLRTLSGQQRLQDALILAIAPVAEAVDQQLMTKGLSSRNPTVVKRAAVALRKIPASPAPEIVLQAIVRAAGLGNESQDVSVRDQLILLLRQQTKKDFGYQVKEAVGQPNRQADGQPNSVQIESLKKWQAYVLGIWPEAAARFEPTETNRELIARMQTVDWAQGLAPDGAKVFDTLQCARCHGQSGSLGPRLEGVTRRMGHADLLLAIIDPDRQVSDRYRATLIETSGGTFYQGVIIYEAADGVTLKETAGTTVRLNQDQIENRRRSTKSMMPAGLLDQATDQQVADLFAYLKTLK